MCYKMANAKKRKKYLSVNSTEFSREKTVLQLSITLQNRKNNLG